MRKAELVKHESGSLVWFSFKELDELSFLKHWITSRHGGVSKEGFATLNLGDHVGDEKESVNENRKRVAKAVCGGSSFFLLKQVHSDVVAEASAGCESSPSADAVVVSEPSLPAGVLTADCLPIIIADRLKKVAAVVHAGRMGVFKNIVGATVKKLLEKGGVSENFVAAIGPGIRDCCYEVGDDVFKDGFTEFRRYLNKEGKLDMVSAVGDQLLKEGLSGGNIFDCGVCSSCSSGDFFSHRKQDGKAGRFLTGAMLEDVS